MKDQTSSYLMVSDIPEDDTVGIIFGPFCAQRHAYIFRTNAFSIQRDEFYGEQRFDGSYDTSGRLQGKITD